jgi:hypothetical protein
VRLDRFEGFLRKGATRPFLALSEEGNRWVVKAHGNPLGTKVIFNDYVAGSLAGHIELPWPKTSTAELGSAVIQRVNQEGLQVRSPWSVCSMHLPHLEPVEGPAGAWDPEHNRSHIENLFGDRRKHAGFYGKAVFDNWLLLNDSKYDALFMTPDEDPIFLDASHALAGEKWDAESLKWSSIRVRSPYLEGVLVDKTEFDPWLERISSIDRTVIKNVLDAVPREWTVPTNYLSALHEFLIATHSTFLREFRGRMDYCYAVADFFF